MCALIVMDGSVGLDPVDIDPRHISSDAELWEIRIASIEDEEGWTDWRIDANRSKPPLSQSRLGFDRQL